VLIVGIGLIGVDVAEDDVDPLLLAVAPVAVDEAGSDCPFDGSDGLFHLGGHHAQHVQPCSNVLTLAGDLEGDDPCLRLAAFEIRSHLDKVCELATLPVEQL